MRTTSRSRDSPRKAVVPAASFSFVLRALLKESEYVEDLKREQATRIHKSLEINAYLYISESLFTAIALRSSANHCCWYLAVNTTIKINQLNSSQWFYSIVATCFGPRFGISSGGLIKYVSSCSTALMWIHISATYHNHAIHATATREQEFFWFKIFQGLKWYKIILSLNVKFHVVFVFMSRIVGCPSPGFAVTLQQLFTNILLVISLF
jgi:hypothetical protein